MNFDAWWFANAGYIETKDDAAKAAWSESRAEFRRQILEEVLPDLHGHYDGRDVVEALRKRIEGL